MIKSKLNLSIVVPTLNESASATALVRRIDAAMHVAGYSYEIIVIDDHSTDSTRATFQKLADDYPVAIYLKVGARGKAQSLIEGFAKAESELIAMIDADLQYPPEALIDMLERLESSVDIVLTSRLVNESSWFRRLSSGVFKFVFVKMLFGLNYDTQSGLKLFRASVLRGLELEPTPWGFDLDFIVRARQAGAVIVQQPIVFGAREYGEAKINVAQAAVELAKASLRLRFDLIKERFFGIKEYGA